MRAFCLLLLAGLIGPAASAQQRNSVVITEVGVNPGGTITDANGEWVELFNNSPFPRDLSGWMVRDSAASGMRPVHRFSSVNGSVIMPPYGFFVMGQNPNTTLNGGVTLDYTYGAIMQLANSLDRVTVLNPDSAYVTYAKYQAAATSAQNGISRERRSIPANPVWLDETYSMDSQTFWADALVTDVYGPGGRGTPGRAGQTDTGGRVPSVKMTTTAQAGYRLLSPPLAGIDLSLLRHANLIQGLADEFAGFGANIFTAYNGTGYGGFVAPTATTSPLEAGRGFLWYMYDAGGPTPEDPRGISRRAELPATLWLGGQERAGDVATTFTAAERTGAVDQFYMVGNPFNSRFDLSGVTASSGVLSEVFQFYDPAVGYVTRTRVPGTGDGDTSDDAAVWEGFFAEFFTPPSFPVTLTYSASGRVAATDGPVAGRSEGATDVAQIGLVLDGTMQSGAVIHDEAARLYFTDLAQFGWDAYDASKMMPFSSPAATIAPVGPGPDAALRQLAQRSLPYALTAPFSTTVGFMATEAGSFTFAVPSYAGVPAGWHVVLTDSVTGAVTTLAEGASYGFTSEATGYSDRFTITVTPSVVTGTEAPAAGSPYVLTAVAPNPSATRAQATILVRDAQAVRAEVYDVLGRRLAVVFDGDLAAGAQQGLAIDAAAFPAGAYVLRVTGEGFAAAQTFHVAR